MNEEDFNNLLKKNWSVFAVAGVFILALYIRLLSLQFVQRYLPDIDTYLFYRLSDYLLNNNFHMMAWDTLRNYPFGLSTAAEQPLPYYLPAIFYKIASVFSNLPYISLVKYYSPIISSLTAIPMYLIGKELKDKWTGIFSAFFFAIMPAILMRNPAGYIEKEPATLVFMMLSVYFFIRTLRKDSWLSAALMGISLLFVDIGWGGVDHLYLSYAIFAGMILLANKYSRALIKNYAFILIAISAGAFVTRGSYFGAEHLMVYLTFLLIIMRWGAERFNLINKESLKYFVPALSAAGIVFVLIASVFSPFFAGFINQANGLLFYDEGVFGGTVAENQRPDLGSFLGQFGTPYAANILPFLQPVLIYLSVWIFAFVALITQKSDSNKKILSASIMVLSFLIYLISPQTSGMKILSILSFFVSLGVMLYITYKSSDKITLLQTITVTAAILSFLAFISGPDSGLQMVYLVSMFASIFLFAKRDASQTLMAIFLFAAMLGFMSKIRVGFLIGPYIAIFGGYFISEAISRIRNMDAVRNAKTLEEKINVYSVGAGGLVALILAANLAAGYAIGSGMGPNYNDNWNNAMNFMKYNTSEDSVILSWWDFGYWFQAMSGRATALDGGNNYYHGDELAGRYFSGRMNESEQKDYLARYGITHVLVDASMIGKYAAMTRIGTNMEEIDQYAPLGNPQQLQKNGKPILVFPLGSNAFYVSVNPNGTSIDTQIQQVTFSTPRGDGNLKYLCTEDGLVDLKAKDPAIDGCLLFTKYGVFFPVDGTRGVPSTLTGTSVFAKLFFFDGKGVDYVKKVYEDQEIRIYEVELPRKTREELLGWWKENVSKEDAFAYSQMQSIKSLCVRGNDIGKCQVS